MNHMEKKLYFLLLLGLSMLFVACGPDSNEPAPEPPGEGSRTVLAYIVADNNIDRFSSDDIAEMVEGMKTVNSSMCNLLVYLDGYSTTPVLYHIVKGKNGEVVKNVIKTYDEQNSTDITVMSEVMNRVFKEYPADSYGLVYWSHGEGWIPYPLPSTRWIGQDNDGDYIRIDNRMNLSAFASVLEKAPHFDFILFDACFMESIEVAYELRKYSDYFISSPTETPGTGAPYDKVVPAMFSENDVAKNIAEAYVGSYIAKFDASLPIGWNNPFNSKGEWIAGVAISVMKSDALENLANITKQVLPEKKVDNSELRRAFNYDKRAGGVGYYDMADIVRSLTDDDAYKAWETAFKEVRVYWNTTKYNFSDYGGVFSATGANGISHYIPSVTNAKANVAYRSTAWYSAAGLSKLGW